MSLIGGCVVALPRSLCSGFRGVSQFPHHAFVASRSDPALTSRTGLASRRWFGLRRSYGGCDQKLVIRSVAFPALLVCLGTASGPLRRPAPAKILLCSRPLHLLA